MEKSTESRHPGEHIVSEANGALSREQGVLISGQNLAAGTVLGVITASGKYTAFDQDAATGEEVAAAVLYAAVDASAADADCVVHARQCEVMADALTWPSDLDAGELVSATIELESQGIIQR